MKKLILIALVLVMALAMCACGNDPAVTDPTGTTGSSANVPTNPIGYTFTYNNVKFGVGMTAENVVKELGDPKDRAVSESCAFGGNDIVYYYGSSVAISTNDENGYERIFCIELVDDLVETEEGVCIGDTADKVKSTYGEASSETDNGLVYNKDSMTLTFILTDGAVSSIQYYAA